MKILSLVVVLILSACAHRRSLSYKEIKDDEILVFGRFTDKNPKSSSKNYFTYQVDETEVIFPDVTHPKPILEKDFFWVLIPKKTQEIRVRSFHLGLDGRSSGKNYTGKGNEPLAVSKIDREKGQVFYLGDIELTTEGDVLKGVNIKASQASAKKFLQNKKIPSDQLREANLELTCGDCRHLHSETTAR